MPWIIGIAAVAVVVYIVRPATFSRNVQTKAPEAPAPAPAPVPVKSDTTKSTADRIDAAIEEADKTVNAAKEAVKTVSGWFK